MNVIFLEAVQIHGGARKSTVELAKRLLNKGNKVQIVDFWGNCQEFVDDVNQNEIPLYILKKRYKPIAIFNAKNIFIILRNFFLFFIEWFKLRREFSKLAFKLNPDIVIINNIKTNSILKKKKSYKIIYFARGWFAYNSLGFLKKLLFRFHSDFFIGVSQSTRQAIFTGGMAPLNKIYVVPNAIDINKVNQYKNTFQRKENDDFVILHCGGFLPAKGQLLSISLAKKLLDNNINFKMILMGSVYDSYDSIYFLEKIKMKINELGIGDRVEIILNHKNPYEVYKKTDLLIHPSDTEGLPRVIMEAMAFQIPVIANPVGGVTDYILNNFTGFIANYNDLQDYYDITLKLYNERDIYSHIQNNAKNLIEKNYSPESQISAFDKVLEKITMT